MESKEILQCVRCGQSAPFSACPVCSGRGQVSWDPALPTISANTSAGPWTCPTCDGGGVLDALGRPIDWHVQKRRSVSAQAPSAASESNRGTSYDQAMAAVLCGKTARRRWWLMNGFLRKREDAIWVFRQDGSEPYVASEADVAATDWKITD